jgi:hypothetical protein
MLITWIAEAPVLRAAHGFEILSRKTAASTNAILGQIACEIFPPFTMILHELV